MKKFILSILFILSTIQIQAGTNAFLLFRTNDLVILPTNLWSSNAAAISAAIGTGSFTNAITNLNAGRAVLAGGLLQTNTVTGDYGSVGTNGTLSTGGTNTNSFVYSNGVLTITGPGNSAVLKLVGANNGGNTATIQNSPAGVSVGPVFISSAGNLSGIGNLAATGAISAASLSGAVLTPGVVTNTPLGFGFLDTPNARNRESLLYSIPLGATSLSGIGDSYMAGFDASPLAQGFGNLIAASNNLAFYNYGASGHCVADYWPEVSNAISDGAPIKLFEGGINNEIRDPSAAMIPGFTMGMLGQLSLLEIGMNRIAGTNMTVISGTWSNTASSISIAQNPGLGVISTTPGSALSNTVAGKTIIIGALDFQGTTNVGGSFSVTIDGVTLATNYLTNAFASIFSLAYQPCAFYYPTYQEGLHSVIITNLGAGNCAIEYLTTVEMAAAPPVIEVFNVPPQTNYATGPGGSAASVDAHNAAIHYVCDLLDYVQFPVAEVDAYGAVMSAMGTNMYNTNIYGAGDTVHLTNGGHLLLAQAAQRQMSRSPVNIKFNDLGMSIHSDGNALVLDESHATASFPAIAIKGTGGGAYTFYIEPNGFGQMANSAITFDPTGNFTAASFVTPGKGTFTNGVASLATNFATPASTTGVTNTSGATWVYDIAGTNVTVVQFDNQATKWDTNANWTGSKELVIQPNGGWTNSGIVTVTGGHAF